VPWAHASCIAQRSEMRLARIDLSTETRKILIIGSAYACGIHLVTITSHTISTVCMQPL
jgi:hypothetical protein